jgi:hypothetical protein
MSPAHFKLACLLALAALGTFRPAVARADIYRCTIDGRLTFRDAPCPNQPAAPPGTVIAEGCYEVDAPGWESGRSRFVLKFSTAGKGRLAMTEPASDGKASVPMRRATPEELRAASALLKFAADAAVVMEVPKGMPNQPAIPIGLYRGRDQYRDDRYFFFGFLANGWARPVACP